MIEDHAIAVVALLGAMTLVGAGLLRRRLPIRQWVWIGLAWVGIIAVAGLIASIGLKIAS